MSAAAGKHDMMGRKGPTHRVLPGFGLTLGVTLCYVCLLVLIPLSTIVLKSLTLTWSAFWGTLLSPRALASYRLSLGASLISALLNAGFGLLVTWVLVRYQFPGKRLLDGLVDLPLALPTAVAGIALTTLYAPHGWIGQYLDSWGIQAAYTPLGIVIALTFIGLPFVIRTLEPVLESFDAIVEEAAGCLGASRWQTFWHVIFPELRPALLTGFALAFARGLGEYGSVIFIAGNLPMRTEITPLLIMIKLEQFDYAGAAALALMLLVISFVLLFAINLWQRHWSGLVWHAGSGT